MLEAVIDDFCDAVPVHELRSGIRAVSEFLTAVDGQAVGKTRREEPQEHAPAFDGLTPWQYGYRQARDLRSRLGISGPIPADLIFILQEALSFEILPLDAPAGIEAIAAPGRAHTATFGITKQIAREESRRFVLCRALSDSLALQTPTLVTRSQTEHQQRNRAFAAEFLAPAAALRERLPRNRLTEEDLEDLAQEFRVSGFVIRHQVENHQLATVTE